MTFTMGFLAGVASVVVFIVICIMGVKCGPPHEDDVTKSPRLPR